MLMEGDSYEVDSPSVLTTSQTSGCWAYDCECAVLAQQLGTTLITFARKVLTAFAQMAATASCYRSRLR